MSTRRLRSALSERCSCALSCVEALLLAVQPRLDAAELGDHDRLAVAQRRDLAGELVELVLVSRELGREHALAVALALRARTGARSSCDCRSCPAAVGRRARAATRSAARARDAGVRGVRWVSTAGIVLRGSRAGDSPARAVAGSRELSRPGADFDGVGTSATAAAGATTGAARRHLGWADAGVGADLRCSRVAAVAGCGGSSATRSERFEATVQHADADGTQIAWYERGRGPALVMLMGTGSTMAEWDPALLRLLARHQRLILFDYPGVGLSGPWRGRSFDSLADSTAALMDAIGVEHADVLGWSMGGFVAQRLAVDHPERVEPPDPRRHQSGRPRGRCSARRQAQRDRQRPEPDRRRDPARALSAGPAGRGRGASCGAS